MAKTHYDPFYNEYDPYGESLPESGFCGAVLQEFMLNVSARKEEVTCKKCIKLFKQADEEREQIINNFW